MKEKKSTITLKPTEEVISCRNLWAAQPTATCMQKTWAPPDWSYKIITMFSSLFYYDFPSPSNPQNAMIACLPRRAENVVLQVTGNNVWWLYKPYIHIIL